MAVKRNVYRVAFVNEGEVWEIYCKRVSQSGLFGFIEIEGVLFGEKTSVVVDPAEERLKKVFDGVGRSHVPLHAIVRIDEVEKRGTVAIHAAPAQPAGKVVTLPSSMHKPGTRR